MSVLDARGLRLVGAREAASRLGLERVRALLGHAQITTTQVYARIQPHGLKDAVRFYEARALEVLS